MEEDEVDNAYYCEMCNGYDSSCYEIIINGMQYNWFSGFIDYYEVLYLLGWDFNIQGDTAPCTYWADAKGNSGTLNKDSDDIWVKDGTVFTVGIK